MRHNVDIPMFTTSPAEENHNGMVCYYHTAEPAVTSCVRCGRSICKSCAEAYSVGIGGYEGNVLCFECYERIGKKMLEI